MKYEIVVNGITFKAGTMEDAVKMAQLFTGASSSNQPVQGTGSKATSSKSTKQAAKEPKAPKLYSTDLKDYEPKAQDGNYVWKSYKAQRSHYCYAVVTKGLVTSSKEAYEKGGEVDYEVAWPKAKAEYEAVYKYITKAQR